MQRNTSINEYFRKLGEAHCPRFRFSGRGAEDWRTWREALLPAVRASLGRMPLKVPLNPEVLAEWTQDGLIKERVLLDVEDGLSATA
jgi:hypothetical protein